MYCFLDFLDSTSTAYPKDPLPTILTFRYFYIQTYNNDYQSLHIKEQTHQFMKNIGTS